ncbi:hypothetical protein F5Y01DRAFT_315269 [Xylaria sp. FL0043]|nr:hypothetical protein F5Y01DRAFT_315269 [Xylaria sp. FL0043]
MCSIIGALLAATLLPCPLLEDLRSQYPDVFAVIDKGAVNNVEFLIAIPDDEDKFKGLYKEPAWYLIILRDTTDPNWFGLYNGQAFDYRQRKSHHTRNKGKTASANANANSSPSSPDTLLPPTHHGPSSLLSILFIAVDSGSATMEGLAAVAAGPGLRKLETLTNQLINLNAPS